MSPHDPCARPLAHLAAAGRRYPAAWRQYDTLRVARGKALPDWPAWCFCPLSGAYAIISRGGDMPIGAPGVADIGRLGALAAWRPTQGVYRIDPTVAAAVRETPLGGEVPAEVLPRLPEWCVWIDDPGVTFIDMPVRGYFAHLEYDSNDGHAELRLALDLGGPPLDSLRCVPLHLGQGSLEGSVRAALDESFRRGLAAAPGDYVPRLAEAVEPLVNLVLLLCTETAARGHRPGTWPPRPPSAKRATSGWRLYPPDRPRLWPIGEALGAAIRRAEAKAATHPRGPIEGERASPRPHVRRAHWHTYWTGPRQGPQPRRAVLKWLPPIAVALEEDDR